MSKHLFTYCIIMFGVFATAQVSFKTVVDKTQLNAGQRVQVSFVITAHHNIDITNVSLPDFKGFQMLGRNSGTNISYRNGQMTRQYAETVVLFVKKPGKYVIAPAKVTIDGKDYESNSVTITVSKNNTQEDGPSLSANTNVKMQIVLSKQEVYPNEPILADIKLYAKSYDLLRRRSDIEVPGISGFQVKQLSHNQERNFQQETIDGVVYVSEEIAQFQLTPTQTGHLEIPSFKIRLAIPIDLFDEKVVLLKTKPTTINVKNLPENAPAGYTGAVGNFKLNTLLDQDNLGVNQSISYEIELIGQGNLSSIELPALTKLPSGIELYPPKRRNAFKNTPKGERGKIVDSYVLVPQQGGKYNIPALSFTYFNPEKEKYITTSTKAIAFEVLEQKEKEVTDTQTPTVVDSTQHVDSDDSVTNINNQVKKLIKIPDLPTYNQDKPMHKYWYALWLIPVLGGVLYFLFKKKKKKKRHTAAIKKDLIEDKKVIKTKLKKQLEELEIAKNHKKIEDFTSLSACILNDVVTYFANTTEEVVYNESQASEILSRNKMPDSFINCWETLHRKNQLMRYSGILPEDSLQDLYAEYEYMVKDLFNIG